MNHRFRSCLPLALALALGCSSGGSSPESIRARLENCAREGLVNLLLVTDEFGRIVEAVESGTTVGQISAVPSTDPSDPPFTYDVVGDFAAFREGPADTRLAGKITFSDDPTDGIDLQDTADCALQVTSLGGPLTGALACRYAFTDVATLTLSGDVTLGNADTACDVVFSIPVDPGLTFAGAGTSPVPQLAADLAANISGTDLTGETAILASIPAHTLLGDLKLVEGIQEAGFAGSIDGEEVEPFSFRTFPAPQEFLDLADCIVEGDAHVGVLLRQFPLLFDALLSAAPVPGVSITRIGNSQWTYAIAFTAFTSNGSVNGSISVRTTFDQPTDVSWQYRLVEFATDGTSRGTSVVIRPRAGIPGSFSGIGRFRLGRTGCTLDVEVPAPTPLRFDLSGDRTDGGRATYRGTIGDDALTVDLDFSFGVDVAILAANWNGVPLPPRFLGIFQP